MHPNATILVLTTALLGFMPVNALGELSNSQVSQSAQTDADEELAPPATEASSPEESAETTTETKKPQVQLTPESNYTVTNTGLKGTQDRMNRPNPLFSPTVAQINLTKGNWDDWPWKASGITGD